MKSRLYIPLILVALSCAILAVALWVGTSDGDGGSNTSSAVLDNIATRTSIRAYTSDPVDDGTVTALLKAGMAAPTAMNTQPWFFYVVRDRELMKSLAEVLPYAKMAADAAVLIVPCGDRERFLTGETCPPLPRTSCWRPTPWDSGPYGPGSTLYGTASQMSPAFWRWMRTTCRSASFPSAGRLTIQSPRTNGIPTRLSTDRRINL